MLFPLLRIAASLLPAIKKSRGKYFRFDDNGICSYLFHCHPAIQNGNILFGKYLFLSIPYSIYFRVDMLGFFLGLLIAFLWLLASIHSIGYMAKEHAHDRYYCFLLLSLGGCLGTVFAGELVGLFLFFEIMAVSSFVLVAHEEHPYAMFAGTKYLFMSIGAGLSIFSVLL